MSEFKTLPPLKQPIGRGIVALPLRGQIALSGPRNPYPGQLGVIEEHALADLLLG